MVVGTRVRILEGMWAGREGVVIEIIACAHTDDRYDVDCVPGRWYYPDELEVLA